MGDILNYVPLFGFVGAVLGLATMLTHRTKSDDERWTIDRRKRERRDLKRPASTPSSRAGERRVSERRRAG